MDGKILDKLKKLMAHAESAKAIGNTAEFKAFKAQFFRLLKKHKITRKKFDEYEQKTKPIGPEPLSSEQTPATLWQKQIAATLCRTNDCELLIGLPGMPNADVLTIFGRETSRKKVIAEFWRFDRTIRSIVDEASKWVREVNTFDMIMTVYGPGLSDHEQQSYTYGLTEGLCQRLMLNYAAKLRDKEEARTNPKSKRRKAVAELAQQEIRPDALAIAEVDERLAVRQELVKLFERRTKMDDDCQLPMADAPEPEPVEVEFDSFQAGMIAAAKIALEETNHLNAA